VAAIVEAVMAEDEAKSVRSPVRRSRRTPREVSWEEMTDYQQMLVTAGETSAGEVPSGMTVEQLTGWMREMVRKA
jgi:hypothetical protein